MSLSDVLSMRGARSRRPGERTSCDTTTRSVPLMMKVPLLGHEREVAHEDRLGLDLAGLVVHELGGDEERGGVGQVALLALVDRVLRRLEAVVAERQRHRPGEVLDRGDLLEDLLETGLGGDVLSAVQSRLDARLPRGVAEQPVEALGLQREKVRNLEGLVDLCKGDAQRGGAGAVVRIRRSRQLREAAKRGSFRGLGLTTRVPVPTGHGQRSDARGQDRAFMSVGAQAKACPW